MMVDVTLQIIKLKRVVTLLNYQLPQRTCNVSVKHVVCITLETCLAVLLIKGGVHGCSVFVLKIIRFIIFYVQIMTTTTSLNMSGVSRRAYLS